MNYGVQPSKSKTVQVTDSCGMLESYSEVDKALADLNGNTSEFRLSEDVAFLEAMSQEFASTIFYGNTNTDPEKFMGLSPRYNLTTAENGGQIIAGDGTGSDNTSMWLVVWGAQTCHGIFPKGSQAGLKHDDLGEVTLSDGQTPAGLYQGYRGHYKWDAGLVLKNWKYVVRMSEIDISNLVIGAATGVNIQDVMVQAIEKIPNLSAGRPVFYANGSILSMLRRQIIAKSNLHLNLEDIAGKKVVTFDGIPVKKCDALLNTEAVVT